LKAETSRSWEAGVRRRCPQSGLRWGLTVFRTELDDLIEFDYASFTFQNVAGADISGVELAGELEVARDLTGRLTLTWLDTEDDQGQELLRRPEWSGSLVLTGRVTEGLRADLVLRWVGSRDDIDPVSFERVAAGGFVTSDLALAWTMAPGVELTGRVLNLADRRYQEVLGYPAPRRRVVAGFRLRR
jgi:vitamin B12 transporter